MLVHCVTDFYFDVAGVVRLRLSTGRVVYTPCCIRRHALKAYETLLQHAIGSAAHHCPFSDSDEIGVIDTGPGLLMVV